MVEHWYDALPAAWFVAEVRWYVLFNVILLLAIGFAAGYLAGRRRSHSRD